VGAGLEPRKEKDLAWAVRHLRRYNMQLWGSSVGLFDPRSGIRVFSGSLTCSNGFRQIQPKRRTLVPARLPHDAQSICIAFLASRVRR
jgi:hypothetical protein